MNTHQTTPTKTDNDVLHWGRPDAVVHRYKDTPFGEVELTDFVKTGPSEYTVMMTIYSSLARNEEMSVTWFNCHSDDANRYFGIQMNEQRMWE